MYKSIRGTKDVFEPEIFKWQKLENLVHNLMKVYNYKEIRTPIFEETALFSRSIGDQTDIVSKEMYTFLDRSNTSLTLKPEMTASVVRAFIQNNLGEIKPLNKFYYISPMFRQERPQAGRLRQFHQIGAEIFGASSYIAEGELIILASEIFKQVGIKKTNLQLNSIGCPNCRPSYIDTLRNYFLQYINELSEDSVRRLDTNPLRILDSKDEKDIRVKTNAPSILNFLCTECQKHFDGLKKFLTTNNIDFEIKPNLVRGLDYYTKTAFEFTASNLGAQDAICGGGRYDLLVSQLGGKDTPAVGWASGMERLILAAEKEQISDTPSLDCFICILGTDIKESVFQLVTQLRNLYITCEIDLLDRSLKAQMREANRQNSKFVLIIGETEFANQKAICKELATGEQVYLEFNEIKNFFIKKLGK